MANAQAPEGRSVVAVPGSKGATNEGVDLDQIVVVLNLHPCLESGIFLLLLGASLGKSVRARLVGDCHVNYESVLVRRSWRTMSGHSASGEKLCSTNMSLSSLLATFTRRWRMVLSFSHEAGVGCAGIEDLAKRFGLSSALGAGGVQSLSRPPDHSLHREEVEASLGGESVGRK